MVYSSNSLIVTSDNSNDEHRKGRRKVLHIYSLNRRKGIRLSWWNNITFSKTHNPQNTDFMSSLSINVELLLSAFQFKEKLGN